MDSNKQIISQDNKQEFDIKSPIFKPKPGWGGKLNKWILANFTDKILPFIAFGSLVFGAYLVFIS